MGVDVVEFLGTYRKTIYRNYLSGYTVCQIVAADVLDLKRQVPKLDKVVVCSGIMPEYLPETPLRIQGAAEETRYGLQIKVLDIFEATWSVQSTAAFLSNSCNGIGAAKASLLAKSFPNLFDIVKTDNAVNTIIAKCPSISFELAATVVDTIRSTSLQKDVYKHIVPFGGSWNAANKLVKKYGAKALEEIKKNPYLAGSDCGIDFYTCDRLAKASNIGATDKKRIDSLLLQAFEGELSHGHTYSLEDDICRLAKKAVMNSVFKEDMAAAIILDALTSASDVVVNVLEDEELVYLKYMLRDETEVAFHISRLLRSAIELNYDSGIYKAIEELCGIKYAEQQKECFGLIQRSGVGIITGSPGTGKTTTLNGIIKAYELLNPQKIIRLCAPTGRAAQRMAESTGREAVTIHRLLDYQPYGNEVVHKDINNPIDADFIIVDEASMLDINLAAILLAAVKSGALVLFLGDTNQLPSVGPGNVLGDLIDCGYVPTVELSVVYRQAALSPIIRCANNINQGVALFEDEEECRIIRTVGEENTANMTISLAIQLYDPQHPFDMQVLCPSHKGAAGVSQMNVELQRILNPPHSQKKELKYGQKTFRVGDKVLFNNNNYLSGYFNGDIGVITSIEHGIIRINALHKEIVVTKNELEDLSLAYAFTVHKAQGNEFKTVVVSLPLSPRNMLKRNLFYTALTRAKDDVYIVSESDAAEIATYSNDAGKRRTKLKERIALLLKK